MGTFIIEGIDLKGIVCCVPSRIKQNSDLTILNEDEKSKLIEAIGIKETRYVDENECTSDLCLKSAKKIISDLNWNTDEIDILVFVSQTADYSLPTTSTILQDKLGLSKSCICLDLPLGCSGYVYGVSVIESMMKACNLKKGLLLAGDTISKIISKNDKSTFPVFGDAGSATAFENTNSTTKSYFDLGSDGSGYKTIMVPNGGSRNQIKTDDLLEEKIDEGISRNKAQLVLEGMDVFSFGITQVPKTVSKLSTSFNINLETIDYYVFHQANLMMNKMIVKKLKLDTTKVLYSLEKFGNTSSASIPLSLVVNLKEQTQKSLDVLFCGFGVGLSWGTLVKKINLEVIDLIEL